MWDKYHMTTAKAAQIAKKRKELLSCLGYEREIFMVLYEEPEGTPRPRARYINKGNIINAAKNYPGYIQIYSITGAADRKFMHQVIEDKEFVELEHLLYTPCDVTYTAYIKTPKAFNVSDTYLAELGLIRPICKPDFDNFAKKYSDMYNGNVWVDDALVMDASIHKYYSILPRVEITLRYMNMLYNRYQASSMIKKAEVIGVDEIKYFKEN